MAKTSYQAELLEFNAGLKALEVKVRVNPPDRVIMSAVYHCSTGQLVYGTWRMGTASAKAEMHFRGASREVVVRMDQGLNHIIGLPGGDLLAATAALKQGPIDQTLGDLSVEELARDMPPAGLREHFRVEDLPVVGHRFVEDVVFDPKTRTEIRRLRGPMGRTELRDGRALVYSMSQSIFDVDLTTGRRTRLHHYEAPYRYGVTVPQLPLPYFVVAIAQELYAVAGSRHEPGVTAYLPPNRIYRHEAASHRWVPIASLDFEPELATADGGRLVIFGGNRLAVFDPATQTLRGSPVGLDGYRATSVARIRSGWAMGLDKRGPPGEAAPFAEVWVLDPDFQSILAKHVIPGGGRVRLTSMATPTPTRD